MARFTHVDDRTTVIELSYEDNQKDYKLELQVSDLNSLKAFIKDNDLSQIETGPELVSEIYRLAEEQKPEFFFSLQFYTDGQIDNGPKNEPACLSLDKGRIDGIYYAEAGQLHDPSEDTPSIQYFRPDGSLEMTMSHIHGDWSSNGPNAKKINEEGQVTKEFNETVILGYGRFVGTFTPLMDALTEPKRRMDTRYIQKQLKPIQQAKAYPM